MYKQPSLYPNSAAQKTPLMLKMTSRPPSTSFLIHSAVTPTYVSLIYMPLISHSQQQSPQHALVAHTLSAILVHVWVEHCITTNNQAKLGVSLPMVTHPTFHIQNFCNKYQKDLNIVKQKWTLHALNTNECDANKLPQWPLAWCQVCNCQDAQACSECQLCRQDWVVKDVSACLGVARGVGDKISGCVEGVVTQWAGFDLHCCQGSAWKVKGLRMIWGWVPWWHPRCLNLPSNSLQKNKHEQMHSTSVVCPSVSEYWGMSIVHVCLFPRNDRRLHMNLDLWRELDIGRDTGWIDCINHQAQGACPP